MQEFALACPQGPFLSPKSQDFVKIRARLFDVWFILAWMKECHSLNCHQKHSQPQTSSFQPQATVIASLLQEQICKVICIHILLIMLMILE